MPAESCFQNTNNFGATSSAWALYDALIEGIDPAARVVDFVLGVHWSALQATCGCGVAYTAHGGAGRVAARDLRGMALRDAAALAKSWCFEDASLGVAALNAWYSAPARLQALAAARGMQAVFDAAGTGPADPACARAASAQNAEGFEGVTGATFHNLPDDGQHVTSPKTGLTDAFDIYKPEIAAFESTHGRRANVCVVGHFPHVAELAQSANLVVLERNCQSVIDTPDPGCEYVIPQADYVFLTGTTLINKTAPRLLELGQSAKVIFVGPSVVPAAALIDAGATTLAGRCVLDAAAAKFACRTNLPFGPALQSYALTR